MRCLSCQHDLSNLTPGLPSGGGRGGGGGEGVHRCPECGRIFDAADPQTFATGPTQLGSLARLGVIILLAVSVSLIVVWLKRVLF